MSSSMTFSAFGFASPDSRTPVATTQRAGRSRVLKDPPALQVLGQHAAAALTGEHRAEHVRIEDVPLAGLIDRRALAVLDRDQPALLHRADGLARHPAADLELGGEIDLSGQHRATWAHARDNVDDQDRHHRTTSSPLARDRS
jgi:hypothetical protein